jgi:hypothetical protein
MNANANEWLPKGIGERESFPRTMRWPKEIAAELEALAEESGQSFSMVALYLIKDALAAKRIRHTKKRSTSQAALKRAV